MEKMILGTVQFGIDYGINNLNGKPSPVTVLDIFKFARKHGISELDTAEDYGVAPELIGDYHASQPRDDAFNVISKVSHHFDIHNSIKDHLKAHLGVLNTSKLSGYLFHNFDMYRKSNFLVDELVKLKAEGLIQKVGVSVYTNEELLSAIDDSRCDIIQLPFNLLDSSPEKTHLLEVAKLANKELHARSVYLQGLFFMPSTQVPLKLRPLIPYLKEISELAREASTNLPNLALQYVYHHPLIDKVLIGVDSIEQLSLNIEALEQPLDTAVFREVDKIQVKDSWLLNPVNWK